MSRRQRADVREIPADPKYGSQEVTRFINVLMVDGKKSLADGIFYDAMRVIEEKTGQPGLNVFRQALSNAKPVLEVRSRRVGGATYQVPMEVDPKRRDSLARRWLVHFARGRAGKTMGDRLAGELLDAARGGGGAAQGRSAPHGRGEQGVCALPLVSGAREKY